ncbi:type III-B CRISPR-associated protein Cas10/Cmr2 [Faucicola atlantae]|uniref:Type III-B CRISPR-associated protein Cas10/Cmr2 n=1 Tax=Faucicola atlantae TaxID=34059 RepID=A0A1B8QEX9_9GAMM|nr:type III-B CRISPR-associated protein Cas10/Cmr2 [Moraxella atlantae]OBX80520.1 type III-B CRISPR-associated protein Cas10/Cmr2 [Moraxella atlantae]
MTKYLVTFSVGPVQGFIASARRSRDLWSGSWLLSELSKTCAKTLKENDATLIFPHIQNDSDLDKNSDFSVGNKIQVIIEVDSLEQLNASINIAKQATLQRFREEANNAKNVLSSFENQLRLDIWKAQASETHDDYVEIQVAWAKIDGDNGYHDAVQKVGRVLASRKATRDFALSATTPYQPERMIPKSSLDGMRETVIQENKQIKDGLRKKLSLSTSEQLDVAGVVKRLGFGEKAEQFTPITRVMADAWIQQLSDSELQSIIVLYEKLYDADLATKVTGNEKIYNKFPYDAQLLYPSRLEKAIQDFPTNQDLKSLQDLLRKDFWSNKKYGEPYRYGVLLLADGDRMGELLDKAKTLEDHQKVTQALSNFAGQAAKTMRNHRGHCIYAGGDDVLGFVPLNTAYDCADNLQQLFFNSLNGVAQQLKAEKSPTLSVGLAICHIMTPLSVIRELAQQAEKFAKGDHVDENKNQETRRNALGILLSIRSGNDTKLRFNWDDTTGLEKFNKMIAWYKDKTIPSRVAYDIRAIHLRTYDFSDEYQPKEDTTLTLRQKIQSAELIRMLNQARTDKGEKIHSDIIKQLKVRGEAVGLDRLANELIVARWLAAKTQRDLGKE